MLAYLLHIRKFIRIILTSIDLCLKFRYRYIHRSIYVALCERLMSHSVVSVLISLTLIDPCRVWCVFQSIHVRYDVTSIDLCVSSWEIEQKKKLRDRCLTIGFQFWSLHTSIDLYLFWETNIHINRSMCSNLEVRCYFLICLNLLLFS